MVVSVHVAFRTISNFLINTFFWCPARNVEWKIQATKTLTNTFVEPTPVVSAILFNFYSNRFVHSVIIFLKSDAPSPDTSNLIQSHTNAHHAASDSRKTTNSETTKLLLRAHIVWPPHQQLWRPPPNRTRTSAEDNNSASIMKSVRWLHALFSRGEEWIGNVGGVEGTWRKKCMREEGEVEGGNVDFQL
jgi:hypothetical protein